MNFVRGVLVTLLFAGFAVFVLTNDQRVTVNLWGIQREMALALPIIFAFLIGFLPMWAKALTERTLLKRKLTKLEATLGRTETDLAQARTELLRPPAAAPQPQTIPQPAPPPGT
jgi:uncharacterized integral membrane protein